MGTWARVIILRGVPIYARGQHVASAGGRLERSKLGGGRKPGGWGGFACWWPGGRLIRVPGGWPPGMGLADGGRRWTTSSSGNVTSWAIVRFPWPGRENTFAPLVMNGLVTETQSKRCLSRRAWQGIAEWIAMKLVNLARFRKRRTHLGVDFQNSSRSGLQAPLGKYNLT